MPRGTLITLLVVTAIVVVVIILYFAVRKGTLKEKAKVQAQEIISKEKDIQKQKLENAPVSRAEILKEIDEWKAALAIWEAAAQGAHTRDGYNTATPTNLTGLPPLVAGTGTVVGGSWHYLGEDIDKNTKYIAQRINALQTEYESLF